MSLILFDVDCDEQYFLQDTDLNTEINMHWICFLVFAIACFEIIKVIDWKNRQSNLKLICLFK